MNDKNGYRLEFMEQYQPPKQPSGKKSKQKPSGCVRALLMLMQLALLGMIAATALFIGGYVIK